MPMSRRKRFSLRATIGYAVFAAIWIFLSDRVLETFSDVETLTRFSTLKGLFFIVVTAAMLWVTLQNAPADTDSNLLDSTSPRFSPAHLLWGLATPLVAGAIQWAFWSAISPIALLLFYPAVFAAAWLGGWPSGILATLLSSALAWFFFMPSQHPPIAALGAFFAMGTLMSLIVAWLRRAEQQLGHSKFEALVEQSLAGIYVIQGQHFRYVNPEFARVLGYDHPNQLIDQMPVIDLVMPQDRARVAELMRRRPDDQNREVRYAFQALRRDGSAVDLEVHGRAVVARTGTLLIGLVLDVTEQRRTQEALRQSEQLLRSVIEGTTDAVFIKDNDGRYLLVNQSAAHFLGQPADQIVGRTDHDLFPPESADLIVARDQEAKTRGSAFTSEERLSMQSGQELTFLVTKGPVFDAQGQMVGLFGLARDVTAMVAVQDDLLEKQRLLNRMSTLAKIGGWSVDLATLQGKRTEGAARILDLDPSLLSSTTFENGLRFFDGAHRQRLEQALARATSHGEPYALELELTSDKGVRKWIRSQGEPIWKDGKVVRLEGAIQDISEVQQARLALQAQQEQLEQTVQQRTAELETARQDAERLTRIKSEFLANMSHEIRTPLHGMLGLAQIGQRHHEGDARQTFTQILDSGRLLLGIINDILDFSKIEAGKLHIEVLPVALGELLNRSAALVRDQAEAKGIALRVHLGEDLPASCDSDPLRLEQILLNLLSNAVKFTEQGQVSLSATRRAQQLVLTVADTGIGMGPRQLAQLFRPFEQADGSTTRQYGGTGLGLTITKRLVELLDGQIQATSTPGEGTCFEVVLPLVDSALPEVAPGSAPAAASPQAGRLAGLHVLAAEDNQVNQFVLRELLGLEGARVTMVNNGLAAVEQVTQDGPAAFDLVLMDIQMPLMDGYEATRRIRVMAPALPVIGQTAHAMPEERAKCLDAGMVDMVVKPINLDDLVNTVRRHAPAR